MADEPKPKTLIDKRWEEGAKDTEFSVRNYWTNLAFWMGSQWVYWSRQENGIRKAAPDEKRSRVTRNRIRRSLRVTMGKLLKNDLQFEVMPQAADDASVRGAQLAQTALGNAKDAKDWESIRSEEVFAALIGGTSAVCLEWDPAGYKAIGTTQSGRMFGEGDVCLSALSIVEFVVQPGVKNGEFATWWIKATAENPEDVQEKFGLKKTPPADANTALSGFNQRVLDLGVGQQGATRSYEGKTLVRTMFQRPTRKNPAGLVQTVVAGEVVEEKKWPFPFKERLNLFIFRDMKVDGRWTGESMVNDAIPVQTELNMARSIIMEHLKKAGNARLWIPDTTIDEDELSDDPGEPAFYNPVPGAKADWASPPTLPQWEVQYPEQAAAEIDDILGVHDISRGDVPTGIESGAALAVLAEKDDTPLGNFARDQAAGWGRIGTAVLECYQHFLRDPHPPRKLQVTPENPNGGPAPRPYSVDFTGDMLHGQTKAVVPLEVMAPTSRAVMEARADALLQMGVFGTPPDIRAYARFADLPNKRLILAALSADADRAQRENEAMFREEMAEPFDFDNHGVHIAEHNQARKSERYERSTPEVQHIFDLHIKAHETLAAQEVGQQEQKSLESPNLAAAPQGAEPAGSGVPAPQGEMAQMAPAPQPFVAPSAEELAAMAASGAPASAEGPTPSQ